MVPRSAFLPAGKQGETLLPHASTGRSSNSLGSVEPWLMRSRALARSTCETLNVTAMEALLRGPTISRKQALCGLDAAPPADQLEQRVAPGVEHDRGEDKHHQRRGDVGR